MPAKRNKLKFDPRYKRAYLYLIGRIEEQAHRIPPKAFKRVGRIKRILLTKGIISTEQQCYLQGFRYALSLKSYDRIVNGVRMEPVHRRVVGAAAYARQK